MLRRRDIVTPATAITSGVATVATRAPKIMAWMAGKSRVSRACGPRLSQLPRNPVPRSTARKVAAAGYAQSRPCRCRLWVSAIAFRSSTVYLLLRYVVVEERGEG